MDYSSTLTAQLCALTNALDDPGLDLQAILAVLSDELTHVVSSFIGLTMTQRFDGFDVAVTAIDAGSADTARASVELQLDSMATATPGCSVVLYARERGAFLQLAADIQRADGPDPGIVLDGPRPSPLPKSGVTGLAELSAVNRAIGVLITRGYFPDEARAELRRRVGDGLDGDGLKGDGLDGGGLDTVPDAARRVLLSTNARRPCDTVPVVRPVASGLDRRGRRPVRR